MTVLPLIVLKFTGRMVLRVFKPSKKGLFYSSVNNDVVLVTTVEDKINKYSVREYSNAKKARELKKYHR